MKRAGVERRFNVCLTHRDRNQRKTGRDGVKAASCERGNWWGKNKAELIPLAPTLSSVCPSSRQFEQGLV